VGWRKQGQNTHSFHPDGARQDRARPDNRYDWFIRPSVLRSICRAVPRARTPTPEVVHAMGLSNDSRWTALSQAINYRGAV